MTWKKVLNNSIPLEVLTEVLPSKGNLVYEYNPFRNYRLTTEKYLYKESYYTLSELKDEFNIIMSSDKKNWLQNGNILENGPILYEKGLLIDFITDEFKFSLDHPVHIMPLYSYDGSVNLIINDGINIPRLINSRFSATGKNTYEIVDRKGNNDTNIYDEGELFDIDTSLYKRVIKIPKIKFQGVSFGGNLKVGNYHFYFKLADADGNETDFVGESGLVSIFVGYNSPDSVHTGNKNENSFKQVNFLLSNIDPAYDTVYVYYSRYTAEDSQNLVTFYKKIDKKYIVNNLGYSNIIITGFENDIDISATDINLSYNVVDSVTTSAICQNRLFLANVHKPDIPYKELSDLSLRFLPYLKLEKYPLLMDLDYIIKSFNLGYYDPQFIYEKTGYWAEEIYRLGIVYILPNGELSPVFNIRGAANIGEFSNNLYSDIPIYKEGKRNYVKYNDEDFLIINENTALLENIKGVIKFKATLDDDTIHSIDIRASKELVEELKKYVKGYFFVRLTRIPTILAQGITIGIDKESGLPCLPTKGGFLSEFENLSQTYVETKDINGVNYISEGFLSRFSYTLKPTGTFFKILSTVLLAVASVASFIPGAGTIVSLAASGVDFIMMSAVTGKFQTAAFVSTLAGAVAAGPLKTIAMQAAKGANAIGWTKTAVKLIKVANDAKKLDKIVKTATTIQKVMSVGTATVKSYDTTSTLISLSEGYTYNGRDTEIPKGFKKVENNSSRILSEIFEDRVIIKDSSKTEVRGIICPDYETNLPYYNQIFTGNNHIIKYAKHQGINLANILKTGSNYFVNNYRHFYLPAYYDANIDKTISAKIISVPDGTKCVGLNNLIFRSRAGEAEEAWRYENIGRKFESNEEIKENTDIVRGNFGSYLAVDTLLLDAATIVNIMIPEYSDSNIENYFKIRMYDTSSFYAISDRIDIFNLSEFWVNRDTKKLNYSDEDGYRYLLYRGDCYICQFTHRINRNFNDPSAPYNDKFVDKGSWKDNYDPDNLEKYELINLGDVNAVPLGMWVTFKLRSSNNLNIRTLDSSYVDEATMTGHPRGYFPYHPMSTEGTFKHPESGIYNKGFSKSLSERWNFELPDVPHIKNWFGTRIMYSDIHINDAYKNGFRVFQGTNYRDYTREYGEITKLISLESSLLCVFEHGIALIPVNERTIAGQGAGGNVYINTSNVLPENPKIISDMFGSQWPESVLKVPGKTGNAPQYVYGVDTIAKKIWRTDGSSIECISDFKVQEFLNNNITLGERELTPKIGIRNVKTHYNAFKRDVMFTFYDNTYGFEEKVWNLCWNELLQLFITFYSWVPSYMENINNIPFSFNRDTSKWIAKLGTSHSKSSFADGITLTNIVINNDNSVDIYKIPIRYINKLGEERVTYYTVTDTTNFIAGLELNNRVLPDSLVFYTIKYDLERDSYLNYKMFDVRPFATKTLPQDAMYANKEVPVYGLFFKPGYNVDNLFSELYYRNILKHSYSDYDSNKRNYINYIDNRPVNLNKDALSLPIYKDITGKRVTLKREEALNPDKLVILLNIKASIQILNFNEAIKLTDNFYNLKAGFESGTTLIDAGYYESVVAITPKWNLLFLSTDFWKHGQAGIINIADDIYPTYWYGRRHPFEFEVVVRNDPSVHKIFTNLEIVSNKAKPESFHYEIIGESYDFAKDKINMYFRLEARKALWLYNGADICYNKNFLKIQPKQLAKSADFPHKYYSRQDTINEIEDSYLRFTLEDNLGYDYRHLSGAEIVYYPTRQEYRIWNHALALDISNEMSIVTDTDSGCRGLIAGNMTYLEDKWRVKINPIIVCYKNEGKLWENTSDWTSPNRPRIPVMNSPIPDEALQLITENNYDVIIPEELLNLGYSDKDIDTDDWLSFVNIYGYDFRGDLNRKETDVRDKFIKIRIRYSGEELAIISFLNTIYRISYA